jgi:hypothetical protein
MAKKNAYLIGAVLLVAAFGAMLGGVTNGQTTWETDAVKGVPVMNGGAGPCSVEFTVNDKAGKPVYAAEVNIHLVYGFHGFRKLDLSAFTNEQGRLNFTGLPARVYRGPLEFAAKKEDHIGSVKWNPVDGCQVKQTIVLSAAGQ